ncbi:hybrid sensor histidine kinase/response regulator [Pseudoroseomonas deserti]|uniref:histidine kinase n=1 Tax=Teichococcus deserti TaxID=1817963 RepID=A0A1V2H7K8_9PROT|nr:response regulator [Pseudoroseomonas deserti]ONG56185.1 hybrid sensor histidine kinase/response regulator [Pseudoroseomonas deserti]
MTAPSILLVEDSDTQALQMRRLLEAQGFAVSRAASAELALEQLNEALPALVIVDYHLPGMNGDELARQIRLSTRTRAIPVLMLTEAREGDLERQGLESGADAYVPKSADPALLLLRLRALLRRRESGTIPGEGPSPQGAAETFRRARLLVVDDSVTYRAYLAGLLGRDGHAVQAVDSAEAALQAVAAAPAELDCVILNAFSHRFDGIALCDRLNALRGAPGESSGFQIVALGHDGAAGREMLAGIFEAGADDLIPATAEARVLSLRIRAALRRKFLQDEDRRAVAERRERELSMRHAQAEAAAAQALARANGELEEANRALRDTQTKLVQSAKMASLGELVAGIAHEINNPLAFIVAHQATVERLLGQVQPMLEDGSAAVPLVTRCRDRSHSMTLGLKRIQDLVLNLRKFSRQDDAFQRVNVPDALDTILALLDHKFADRLEIRRDYRAVPELRCSPSLLNQVVMNIVSNAADAIEGRGSIAVETDNDAESYRISVTDSGPGVPEDLRERIFEPFFTTKPVGAGTGLGLAIAYNVIQAHDGTISVGSGPQGGACFVVSVPMQPGR